MPGRAGLHSDGLEGYTRTFLLAAFRIAGADGNVPAGLVERYADGVTRGTDPDHSFAWPAIADCSQQLVEAASIALALHETRRWLFDRFDSSVQERVVAWLAGAVGKRTWQSNWVLFPVVVQQFLASVGAPHDPAAISEGLDRIEQWYVGDGWYTDGAGRSFDYYAGWALHLYPLLCTRMSGDRQRAEVYRKRLRAFLEQYQHMFAGDGAPVHQGRSLCYRFASAAVAGRADGRDSAARRSHPADRERRAAPLRRARGAGRARPAQPRLVRPVPAEHAALLRSGVAVLGEQGVLGLLLPADHPVWTVPESSAPIDDGDQVVAMPGPGWLLHATRDDGVVRVVNHGSDRARHLPADGIDDPHYTRFGYSSHAAPETSADARARAVDGHLAVIGPGGVISRCRHIEPITVADRHNEGVRTRRRPWPEDLGMLTGRMIERGAIAHAVLPLSSPTMPSVIGSPWAVDAGSTTVA